MSRLNVLLITSEDNGPHLGCYGDRTIHTPHLDRLASQGACFAKACHPSRVQSISFAHRDVRQTAEVAGKFMRNGHEPFFLMVNYADAHLPWLPQECDIPPQPLSADDVTVPAGVDSPLLAAAPYGGGRSL